MSMLKKTLKSAESLLLILFVLSGNLSAQNKKDSVSMKIELGEVVVGATAISQKNKLRPKKYRCMRKITFQMH